MQISRNLQEIPTYFEDIIIFEQIKYNNNTFMHPLVKEIVMDQISQMLDANLYTIFVINFNKKIEQNVELDAEMYIEQNIEYFNTYVKPAYEYLLVNFMKIDSNSEYDVFDTGYYNYLLETNVGTSLDIDSITRIIEENQVKYWKNITDIQKKYAGNIGNVFNMANIISDGSDILNILEKNMEKDFYCLRESIQYNIKDIYEEIEELMPEAYYVSSTTDGGTIYFNNDIVDLNLFATIAHEAFPGHMMQTNYSNTVINNKLRSYLVYEGFTEGWGTYAEMLGYKYYGADDNFISYCTNMKLMDLSIYAMIDVGVNYLKWNEKDVFNYLNQYSDVSHDDVKNIIAIVKGEPTYYLTYYIGYMEISNILLPESENEREVINSKEVYHDLLSVGSAHFDIVKKYMNKD